MFKLIIQDDEGKTTVVPLIRDEITIGRKEGNTIRLTERNVSRKHARLVRSNGSVLIEDLDSYNGIRVNGTRIQGRVSIGETDRIQIGDYLLELKLDRAAQAGDPYAEQRTQPMDRTDPAAAVPTALPGAPTVPSGPPAMPPPHANGNGAAAKAVAEEGPTAVVHRDSVAGAPRRASGSGEMAAVATPAPASAAAAAPAPAPAPQPDLPARLVVMSANFAGREFQLDRPAMVIGRTDDNDVVINHRSISRHHAKIVREHGRYAIVDLQSSNGVRVNGEEYGKVELRRGDLIDLGHVRLRFVEPGEDFVFQRDGTVVDLTAQSSRGNKSTIIAIAGVLLLGGLAAVVMMSRGDDDKRETANGPQDTKGAITPQPPSAKADASPRPVIAPPNEVDRHLAAAKEAVEAERWGDALAEAKLALKLEADHSEAKRIEEQATREVRNQEIYEDFQKAAQAKRIDEMVKAYRKLPDDSVYRAKATPEYERIRDDWVKAQEAAAARFADQGKCDKIPPIERKITELFPEARSGIDAILRGCTATAVRDPQPPPRDPDPPPRDPTPSGDFDTVLKEARDAYMQGHYAKSLAKAEEALGIRPGDQSATQVAALAACMMGSRERAKKYIDRLKGSRQNQTKQICAKQGIEL